jgi:hypothetical protein
MEYTVQDVPCRTPLSCQVNLGAVHQAWATAVLLVPRSVTKGPKELYAIGIPLTELTDTPHSMTRVH